MSVAGCVWTLGNGSSAGGGAAVAEKHLLSCTPRRSAAHGSAERAKPPAQRVSAQQRQRARALHTHRGCCASPQGHAARCGRAGVTQPQLAARSPRRAAAARRLERTSAKLSSGAALRGLGTAPVRCLGHHAHAMTIQPDVTRPRRALLACCFNAPRARLHPAAQRQALAAPLGPKSWRLELSRSRLVSAATSSAPRCSTHSWRRRVRRATTLAPQLGRRVPAALTCVRQA